MIATRPQRTRAAIVLTRTDRGATVPTCTVYVTGNAPARRLYATVLAQALLDEGAGHVTEEHVRIAEVGPRETKVGRTPVR